MKRRLIRTLITGTVVGSLIVAPVYAAPQDDVESLENQKSQAEAQAASVNQNLVDLLVEYEALQTDMENQEKEIDQAGKDLEKAEAKEKQQYEDMKLRIKYMYENGEESYLSVLVSATDFADFVNKAEYVQKVNKYDRDMLDEYVATKNEIKDLKVDLEAGQATMSDMARDMESQKSSLESTLTQMQSQIADFDTQLAAAREAAAAQLEELTNEADTSAADEVIETVAGKYGAMPGIRHYLWKQTFRQFQQSARPVERAASRPAVLLRRQVPSRAMLRWDSRSPIRDVSTLGIPMYMAGTA